MKALPAILATMVLAIATAAFMLLAPTAALKISTISLAVALGIWTATRFRNLAKAASFDEIANRRQVLVGFLAATALTTAMAAILFIVVP